MRLATLGLLLASVWAGDDDNNNDNSNNNNNNNNNLAWTFAASTNLHPDIQGPASLAWLPPSLCGSCGDPCTRNGRSGYCGRNNICQVGGARPLCGIDMGCTSDASCPDGQTCIRIGSIGRCIGRVCRNIFSAATDLSANAATSDADVGSATTLSLPWNTCPSGYRCVNGQCKMCPALKCANPNCPGGTRTPTDSNGCPGCPVCIDRGCTDDSSCPAGQQCVRIGSFGSCQVRTCFSLPFAASDSLTASAAPSFAADASVSSSLYPWNRCPSGQRCVNGVCRVCPVVDCMPPVCEGGTLVPSTMSNGCPGCPKCEGGNSDYCFNDASCPAGQQCVRSGFYGKCQKRKCSPNRPFSASDSFTSSTAATAASAASASAALDTSSTFALYWNRCPSGQFCENGECLPCPMPMCIRPICPAGSNIIYPPSDNGCPTCPRCSPCYGPSCLMVLEEKASP